MPRQLAATHACVPLHRLPLRQAARPCPCLLPLPLALALTLTLPRARGNIREGRCAVGLPLLQWPFSALVPNRLLHYTGCTPLRPLIRLHLGQQRAKEGVRRLLRLGRDCHLCFLPRLCPVLNPF